MLQMKKELHFFSKNSPEAQTLFPPKQSMLMVELLLFKHSSLMKKLSKHKLKVKFLINLNSKNIINLT
jgi:hypothetical protein